MQWILDRLKEPSTWAGLATAITATGLAWSGELVMGVGSVVIALVGLYEIVRKEKDAKDEG